jgi:hypothetical protein
MRLSVTPKRTGVLQAITRPKTCVIHWSRNIEDVVPDVAPLTNNSHLYCFTLFIGRTLPTTRKMKSRLLECLPFQWNFPSPRLLPPGCGTGITSPSQTPHKRRSGVSFSITPNTKTHVLFTLLHSIACNIKQKIASSPKKLHNSRNPRDLRKIVTLIHTHSWGTDPHLRKRLSFFSTRIANDDDE